MPDPELTIDRAMMEYKQLGYSSDTWINQRLKSIEVRKELTEEWKQSGLQQGRQFAVLANIITQSVPRALRNGCRQASKRRNASGRRTCATR